MANSQVEARAENQIRLRICWNWSISVPIQSLVVRVPNLVCLCQHIHCIHQRHQDGIGKPEI